MTFFSCETKATKASESQKWKNPLFRESRLFGQDGQTLNFDFRLKLVFGESSAQTQFARKIQGETTLDNSNWNSSTCSQLLRTKKNQTRNLYHIT